MAGKVSKVTRFLKGALVVAKGVSKPNFPGSLMPRPCRSHFDGKTTGWPEWLTNLHGAEATWPPRGHNGSQICTAPRLRGHAAVTNGHNFAQRRGPVASRRSRWVTNLHCAEAPWPGALTMGHKFARRRGPATTNRSQICAAPRPRGRLAVTIGHKFARGLGAVQIWNPL